MKARLEAAFRARNVVESSRVNCNGLAEGEGKGFEGGFRLVMIVGTFQDGNVQSELGGHCERLEDVSQHLGRDLAHLLTYQLEVNVC